MSGNENEQQNISRITDFYDGKSIFLTGASGFLGSVLLEMLLRCFPGINKIYILMRKKKNVEPESRKRIVFQKRIFTSILKEKPNITDKVHIVPGEITLPNLGLSNEDLMKIVEDVSIVFHCAASVSFTKSLRSSVLQNCVGTKNVMLISRKLNNLDVLVYTSTAYSAVNYGSYVEEHVYRLPFPAERFLDELEKGTDESFERLKDYCKPDWPNCYTFSKNLAENLLQDNASDLPVVIVRPSIILPTWKGAQPGYSDAGNPIFEYLMAMARGLLRVVSGNFNTHACSVSVDLVGLTLVTAAWNTALKRPPSPAVINCTSGPLQKIAYGKFCESLVNYGSQNTLPLSFAKPSIKVINNRFFYILYAIYEHYIPALFFDIFLVLKGQTPRMVSTYLFFESLMINYNFFVCNDFELEVSQLHNLIEQLGPKDKELLGNDFDELVVTELTYKMCQTSLDNWKVDKKSKQNRKLTVMRRSLFISIIKKAELLFLGWLIYLIIMKICY